MDPRLAGLNKLQYSVWMSRGAGLCLGVDGLLLILPGEWLLKKSFLDDPADELTYGCLARTVLRNVVRVLRPSLAWLMPLDYNIWFHRQIAYSLLFWTIVHTTAHCAYKIPWEKKEMIFFSSASLRSLIPRCQHDSCRTDSGSKRNGRSDYVHSAWRFYRSRYARDNASHVRPHFFLPHCH